MTSEANWWVTASFCIKKGGTCCKPGGWFTRVASGIVMSLLLVLFVPLGTQVPYDPRRNTTQLFCNYCYNGTVATTSTGSKTCSGRLVASINYTARDCTYFGGKCCDMDATTTSPLSGRVFSNNVPVTEFVKEMSFFCLLKVEAPTARSGFLTSRVTAVSVDLQPENDVVITCSSHGMIK